MTLRVWLNRTFATNYHAVGMLKNNPDNTPVHVLASHPDPNSPVLAAADETHPDPVDLDPDAYVDHALAFCRTHGVDVFWPTWQQEPIARAAGRFADAGVRVMAATPDAIRLFEDKAAAYKAATRLGLPVPDHHVVTTVAGFVDAYTALKGAGHAQVCFKPVEGVGASGFRIVSNGPRTFDALLAKAGDHISYDEAVSLLAQRPMFPALMVMPFLAGGEVSVDVLAHNGRVLTAVPRFKRPGTRAVELLHDPQLISEAATVVQAYGMSYLLNVQSRFDDHGNHFLLEVNTRASGGLFQSCLAGGNLPWAAVQVALHGDNATVPPPRFPARLTTLSTAVEL